MRTGPSLRSSYTRSRSRSLSHLTNLFLSMFADLPGISFASSAHFVPLVSTSLSSKLSSSTLHLPLFSVAIFRTKCEFALVDTTIAGRSLACTQHILRIFSFLLTVKMVIVTFAALLSEPSWNLLGDFGPVAVGDATCSFG